MVASYNGSGSLIADYIYGLGLVSQTGPSGTGYYDFDASGNTVGITGSSGTYVNQYSYLPFGETTTISAALPNPFTFAGQAGVMQIGTNLFYMRARDYTPATGQFLSNDPLGLGGRRYQHPPLRRQRSRQLRRSDRALIRYEPSIRLDAGSLGMASSNAVRGRRLAANLRQTSARRCTDDHGSRKRLPWSTTGDDRGHRYRAAQASTARIRPAELLDGCSSSTTVCCGNRLDGQSQTR